MRLAELAFFTNDVDSTAAFYECLLGATPDYRGDGIAIFKVGDAEVLIHKKVAVAPGDPPCENHVALAVADVEQTVAALEASGLSVEIPIRDYDWGRSAYLRDPDGQLWEIQQE